MIHHILLVDIHNNCASFCCYGYFIFDLATWKLNKQNKYQVISQEGCHGTGERQIPYHRLHKESWVDQYVLSAPSKHLRGSLSWLGLFHDWTSWDQIFSPLSKSDDLRIDEDTWTCNMNAIILWIQKCSDISLGDVDNLRYHRNKVSNKWNTEQYYGW